MGDYSQPQLEAMGLCPIRENLDQHIGYGKWDERRNFHTLVKAVTNQTDKPASTVMWRCEAGNNILTAVRCNMGIHIIKLSAIVPEGNTDGTDKPLNDEHYLGKKETGVWSLKHLTSAEGPHQKNSHLTQASNSDNYSVRDYLEMLTEGLRRPFALTDCICTYYLVLIIETFSQFIFVFIRIKIE